MGKQRTSAVRDVTLSPVDSRYTARNTMLQAKLSHREQKSSQCKVKVSNHIVH